MRRFVFPPLAALGAALAACSRAAPGDRPAAEFLVAGADSTYWATSDASGVRLRGAPLTLASADGRFYELFVADDDRSFYDAVLVGQRLYRRDLLTGDSAVVFADSVVPRLARGYADAHPAEYPLSPDEEPSDDPALVANAEVGVVAVHGPFATYEYHTDVERVGAASRSVLRRGVLDWRTGHAVPLSALVGPDAARAATAEGRRRFASAVDSVRRSSDPRADDARAAVGALHFDERSFSITSVDGRPAVAFDAAGAGDDGEEIVLPLAPVVAPVAPPWWPAAAAAAAARAPDDSTDVWPGRRYGVRVRYSGDSVAALAIVDGRRAWLVGRVQPSVARVVRLDDPPVDAGTRRALQRAFDESALYDEGARLAARVRRHPPSAAGARFVSAAGRRGSP